MTKQTMIIFPTWNPDEPRFIVEQCHHGCAEDRQFQNNTCVYNQRLGIAYSADEITMALNDTTLDDLQDTIRQIYLDTKNNKDDERLWSKEQVLNIIRHIAEIGDVDLKEYPTITLEEILGDISDD